MSKSDLKRRIMTRVYFLYTKDLVKERFDYFMLGAFVLVSFILVSTIDVFNNIPKNDWGAFVNFSVVAIRDTSWIIKAFIFGFVIRLAIGSALIAYRNIWPKLSPIRFKY